MTFLGLFENLVDLSGGTEFEGWWQERKSECKNQFPNECRIQNLNFQTFMIWYLEFEYCLEIGL